MMDKLEKTFVLYKCCQVCPIKMFFAKSPFLYSSVKWLMYNNFKW